MYKQKLFFGHFFFVFFLIMDAKGKMVILYQIIQIREQRILKVHPGHITK